jgi:hypothetical protein
VIASQCSNVAASWRSARRPSWLAGSRPGYTVEPLDVGTIRVHGVEYDHVPGIVRALTDADIDVYGVAIDQPTLTDFYLALHHDDPESSHA